MNEAHLHLVVNHFPIIVPIIALLVLIGGFVFGAEVVKRTAYCLFILGAALTIVAFETGEGAEEMLEHQKGISENLIEAHEEASEVFAVLHYILGGLAFLALLASWRKQFYANFLAIAVLLFSFVVLYFAQQAGNSGGKIRHPEIYQKISSQAEHDHD